MSDRAMRPWTQEERTAEAERVRSRLKQYQVWNCAGGHWVPYTQTNDLADLEWVREWNLDYVVVDCHQWWINHVWTVVLESRGHRRAVGNEALRLAEIKKYLIGNVQTTQEVR